MVRKHGIKERYERFKIYVKKTFFTLYGDKKVDVGVCKGCGKMFLIYPSHTEKEFCHKQCYYDKWHSLTKNKYQRPPPRHLIEELITKFLGGKCEVCEEDNLVYLSIHNKLDGISNKGHKRSVLKNMINYPHLARKRYEVLCWNHYALKVFHPKQFKVEKKAGNLGP